MLQSCLSFTSIPPIGILSPSNPKRGKTPQMKFETQGEGKAFWLASS